ncbi:MAG: CotH kinase family protein [Acholeplasmataceae bacterium]|nr:CotH kinase family protein [Acholeplasmataceae bacterium]
MHIDTKDMAIIDRDDLYIPCTISITNTDTSLMMQHVPSSIRLRGHSTQMHDKKPYRIRFDNKQQPLGLGSSSARSWVLLAEYYDPSMLRNKLVFDLAKNLANIEYSSSTAYVEVMLNGEFQGVYVLAEQVQVNPARVNIDALGVDNPDILDTGYLLELEAMNNRRLEEGVEGVDWFAVTGYAETSFPIEWWHYEDYLTAEEVAFYVVKSDAKSDAQISFIQAYMIDVYDAIYEIQTQSSIESLVDMDSAVDMYILQLLANDYDSNLSSSFVYKDKDDKLKFGPPWDFDLSFGNHAAHNSTDTIHLHHLLYQLSTLVWFQQKVLARWTFINAPSQDFIERMKTSIYTTSEDYSDAFEANYLMWHKHAVIGIWDFSYRTGITSQISAADYFYTWLTQRKAWMETYFSSWMT